MASPDLLSNAESLSSTASNVHAASEVAAILHDRGWILAQGADGSSATAYEAWCVRAAGLLGPHANDLETLGALLSLIFRYDAAALLQQPQSQALLTRKGSREVIRALANLLLDGGELDSDRFQEIVGGIKAAVPYRSRSLFQPIRLALAGSVGEGEMDRVILLLDQAARLPFAPAVKSTRQRMLEFCTSLE